MNQKGLDGFFRRLLAMINGGVEWSIFSAVPSSWAERKSLAALASQERTNSLRVSSIHPAAFLQYLVGQASRHFADAGSRSISTSTASAVAADSF